MKIAPPKWRAGCAPGTALFKIVELGRFPNDCEEQWWLFTAALISSALTGMWTKRFWLGVATDGKKLLPWWKQEVRYALRAKNV